MEHTNRPLFPKRAVITAGMPYGNKELHFGHVGGLFVHADIFARFLRDRIGSENVIFISGTDCYGSPVMESYRKLKNDGYTGSIIDYVKEKNESQKKTLKDYEISLDLFGASAFGQTGKTHAMVSKFIFDSLYSSGQLKKMSTPQFFDERYGVFLNGRQVIGKCPIQGCSSEKAYADECSLGHQYRPEDLMNPISTLSGETPQIKEAMNWYFSLDECRNLLTQILNQQDCALFPTRKFQRNIQQEFYKDPCIYVKREILSVPSLLEQAAPRKIIDDNKSSSVAFVYQNLEERDCAKKILEQHKIKFRTGKTLVPFRISGNAEWGVPVPSKESLNDLTFWVWPESLWAPISFTIAYLNDNDGKGTWRDWWNNRDSQVFQFIGEDNVYFYSIAEMALLAAYFSSEENVPIAQIVSKLNFPVVIANHHVLFMNSKASSSSNIKPPPAQKLLDYYTAEQLRIHFFSLGLANQSANFAPQALDSSSKYEMKRDPVLREGNLLTNVFNRLVRSCIYTTQRYFDSFLPKEELSPEIKNLIEETILKYERLMHDFEFNKIYSLLETFIKTFSKHWSSNIKVADKENDDYLRAKTISDCIAGVRCALSLLHPIAPQGCELVREHLCLDSKIWSWDYIFEPIYYFMDEAKKYKIKFLPPHTDFFKMHDIQIEQLRNGQSPA